MTLTLSTKSSIIPPMIENRVKHTVNKNQLRRNSSAVVTRSTNEEFISTKWYSNKKQETKASQRASDEPKKSC